MPSASAATCGRGMGFCASAASPAAALNGRQRAARAAAGVALLGVAIATRRARRSTRVLVPAFGWLGASHVVAAVSAYNGCPELGAIPSMVRGRRVHTHCGPWRAIDARLGLDDSPSGTGAFDV